MEKTAKTTKTAKTAKPKKAKKPAPAVKKEDGKIAVIFTGGKQYVIHEGQALKVEKLPAKDGKVVFDKVLLIAEGEAVKIGDPYISGAKVEAELEGNIRDKKITVFKYKNKTRYRVKKGHRQTHSKIKITSIK